eukprot:2317190-Rhodomonas_salina.1
MQSKPAAAPHFQWTKDQRLEAGGQIFQAIGQIFEGAGRKRKGGQTSALELDGLHAALLEQTVRVALRLLRAHLPEPCDVTRLPAT